MDRNFFPASLFNSKNQEQLILHFVVLNKGQLSKTAYHLGIDRSTLYRKIDRLGLWPAINEIRRSHVKRSRLRKSLGIDD